MRFDSIRPVVPALLAVYGLYSAPLTAQVSVTTYHNDLSRTGANTQETILTPQNVNSAQFGKWFSAAVDGQVYAQPLVVSNVRIAGGTHSVVYVATEHDSVYAFDAATGALYWHISLIPPGGTTVSAGMNNGSAVNCFLLTPEIGITGTPVIDAVSGPAGTGTLYLVAESLLGGVISHTLHALDLGTGAEKPGAPVAIKASAAGTAYDGNGTTVSFSPATHLQRAALLLENGHLVITFTSNCDSLPWHGWVLSYNAATLAQEAVFNPSANGIGNAIWMSGAGPAADAAGNIYFATGNGSWNGITDFGDSVVKLGPPAGGTFPVADFFTPYNQLSLANIDADVGSGGVVLLPTVVSTGRQFLAQMGKEGKIYLLDRNNMGHSCTTLATPCTSNDPQIAQEIPNATPGVWGAPAYWNGNIYWGGAADTPTPDYLKAFSVNATSGLLSTAPTSHSAQLFSYGAPVPAISANGAAGGILWGLDDSQYGNFCMSGAGCQVLYAYDAINLANLLYSSGQAPGNRDVPGAAVKFATPTIVNGQVFVGGNGSLSVYGLLNAGPVNTSVAVNLAGAANVNAISNLGVSPVNGGVDADGYAYAAALLSASINWNGATFTLGNGSVPSAVSGGTLTLPAGSFATLDLIATAVNGPQTNQSFVVTYTDGTTSTFTQSLSDWGGPQNFAGESVASNTQYRIIPGGNPSKGTWTWFMYGYSFALNAAKTVKSVRLPANRNVVVLAAALLPAAVAGSTGTGTGTGTGSGSGASSVIAPPQPAFTLTPTLSALTLQQNAGGTITINVNPVNGFAGSVYFAVSGLPAGVSSVFIGNLLVLYPSPATASGTYPLTIIGTSTGTAATTTAKTGLSLVITAGAAFSLAPASSTVSVTHGASITDVIKISPVNGFMGTVALSAAGMPAGAGAQFAPSSTTGSTTLTLTTAATTPKGSHPIILTGTTPATNNSAGFSETATVNLVVN